MSSSLWVSKISHLTLKRNEVPAQSLLNSMEMDRIALQLKDMNPVQTVRDQSKDTFQKTCGPAQMRTNQYLCLCRQCTIYTAIRFVISTKDARFGCGYLTRRLVYKGYYMHKCVHPKKINGGFLAAFRKIILCTRTFQFFTNRETAGGKMTRICGLYGKTFRNRY